MMGFLSRWFHSDSGPRYCKDCEWCRPQPEKQLAEAFCGYPCVRHPVTGCAHHQCVTVRASLSSARPRWSGAVCGPSAMWWLPKAEAAGATGVGEGGSRWANIIDHCN